jgi:Ca2+-binding RTX toxin-like protein
MKRLGLIATCLVAGCAAAPAPAAEQPVTVLLAGGPQVDVLDIKLSQDGRSYLIDSMAPLEAGGGICANVAGSVHDLECEAGAIGGFEVNAGPGDDHVIISPKIIVPTTLRGGPGDDRLRGGSGADKILGGPGHDTLYGMQAQDWLFGGPGEDWLYGGAREDRLVGGPDADWLHGGSGVDSEELGPDDSNQGVTPPGRQPTP